ncbi:MAG: S9 family peptidase [Muribaculaceae bacterium]|nr:S9 family peptidase [Muribaculaceae bacterium]
MKYYPCTLALLFMGTVTVGQATPLNVEDYCDVKISAPVSIKEMRPLADGLTYAAISDDGRSIEVYSYKSGKKVNTLFSVDAIKGDVKIDGFEGYVLSDNERKILLWNNSEAIYRHSFTADYYVYDIMRGTMARVSEKEGLRCATMSHDGRMVAYVYDNNIYISNLDYQTDRPITEDGVKNEIINGAPDWAYEEEFGIENTIRWSADDSILAYIRFDERKVPVYSFDDYRSYCDNEPLGDPYPESFRYKYPLPGYPNSKVSVHAYELDNRVTKTMDLKLDENDYVPSMEFGGEGTQLMVMVLNRDQNRLELNSVNPKSTVARAILKENSDAWLNPTAYQMADYGSSSFVIGSERSGYLHLYEYDYSGNLKRQITNGSYNVTAYYGTDKRNGTVYAQTTCKGAINRNVVKVDRNGKMIVLNNQEGTESASFSKNFDYFVRTYSSSTVPPQYTICNSSGNMIAEVEMNREYAMKYAQAPKMEFLTVPNAEGKEMNAYIIKPANFDSSKKYKLLMYQYNGPGSQEVLNRWRMEGIFYLASEGYVVACVDGRGTGNRDRAWATAVYKRLGQYETADQIAGAKYFCNLPYIDASKAACFGWSYGGYMTLMELSDPSNPFKAGVAMAPVTDWRYYDSIYTERYMQTPQQNEAGYTQGSALNRTRDMQRKLLIMSGTSDDNVHFYNTLKYTSKLNSEGTLFDMMAYTGFEHSLRMCNARTMLFRKVLQFLNTNL